MPAEAGMTGGSPRQTRRAGRHPRLHGCHRVFLRDQDPQAIPAWIPSPRGPLGVREVVNEVIHRALAVALRILDRHAEFARRKIDEYHLHVGWRQVPVPRTGWRMRAQIRRRVPSLMAGTALQRGYAFAIDAALDVLRDRK